MALWNGSVINNTEFAMVFNQLANLQAIPQVVKRNALLYYLIGKMLPGSVDKGRVEFERSKKITGKNIEVKLFGALTGTQKLADGAPEYATTPPSFNANSYGAAEFPLTRYYLKKAVPTSQLDRYKGKEAKTDDFYAEVMRDIMASFENDIGNDLHGTSGGTNIGRTVLGSWCYAVSTGGGDAGGDATGEAATAFRNYGTVDRQDTANSDFRSVVQANYGPSTLQKLRSLRNLVEANGGTVDICVFPTALFTTHELLLEAQTLVTNPGDGIDFGGRVFTYAGMKFIHDQRAPANTIGLLDSSEWMFVENEEKLAPQGMIWDPSLSASYVIPCYRWVQLICKRPNWQGKALGAQ
jgi:hypothetical protein